MIYLPAGTELIAHAYIATVMSAIIAMNANDSPISFRTRFVLRFGAYHPMPWITVSSYLSNMNVCILVCSTF